MGAAEQRPCAPLLGAAALRAAAPLHCHAPPRWPAPPPAPSAPEPAPRSGPFSRPRRDQADSAVGSCGRLVRCGRKWSFRFWKNGASRFHNCAGDGQIFLVDPIFSCGRTVDPVFSVCEVCILILATRKTPLGISDVRSRTDESRRSRSVGPWGVRPPESVQKGGPPWPGATADRFSVRAPFLNRFFLLPLGPRNFRCVGTVKILEPIRAAQKPSQKWSQNRDFGRFRAGLQIPSK